MDREKFFRIRSYAISALLLLFLATGWELPAATGQSNDKTPEAEPGQTRLKVSSNMVVMRVVVRDAKGNPVEGRKKEDFRLFDRGKEQTISQFEEHASASSIATPSVASSPGQAASAPALPENFMALYFDDLHIPDASLIQVRDAADRYIAAHLQPNERVAIFTSDGMLADFSSDPKQIHEALFKLHVSPRSPSMDGDCHLSDYEASEIVKYEGRFDPNDDLWEAALIDSAHCDQSIKPMDQEVQVEVKSTTKSGSGTPGTPQVEFIPGGIPPLALRVEDQARILVQSDLDGLGFAVKAAARMPGRRTVILVSPGFLSERVQKEVNKIIDLALSSQVVISSLDPRGLAVLIPIADASKKISTNEPNALAAEGRINKLRDMVAAGVLEEIAYSTGGDFYRNDNNLSAGLALLSGSPAYYILAFAPRDLVMDGQFHALKVALTGERKGFSIQTRRGYYASANANQTESVLAGAHGIGSGSTQGSAVASSTDAATHEQIREALYANNDLAELTVTADTKLVEGTGETRELSVTTHLDGKGLSFSKNGENNINTVTFVFGVFDQKGNLLTAQQRHDDLEVADGQLPDFLHAGVIESVSFQLKPGSYRLREVVIEAEQHSMATFSRNVKIP